MAVQLVADEYGKAEIRLLHVDRSGDEHEIRDLAVSVSLSGDFAAAHVAGDNANVLPTDTQKNTVYAVAFEYGVGEVEEFALRLAGHFVESHPPVRQARVAIEQYGWERAGPHSFLGTRGRRTATAVRGGDRTRLVSGIADLSLLNTTGSEFTGFAVDRYTTLPEATDRILATQVSARWQHTSSTVDWAESHAKVSRHLVAAFAETYSHSVQHTLYAMAERVIENRPEIAAIHLTLPNRHHLPVDIGRFGLANENRVYEVPDRPYGLIEATVAREGVDAVDWD